MRWTFKLVFEAVPGIPVEHEVGIIERVEEVSPASVGLTIEEGRAPAIVNAPLDNSRWLQVTA